MARQSQTQSTENKREKKEEEQRPKNPALEEARALLAELLGTFALTFVGAGAVVIAAVSHDEVNYVAKVTAPGLAVMAMIYTLGDISGAHVNPVVTLAFALRRSF